MFWQQVSPKFYAFTPWFASILYRTSQFRSRFEHKRLFCLETEIQNFNTVSIFMTTNFLSKTGPILVFLKSILSIESSFRFETSCILGINVASLVLLLYQVSRSIVLFRQSSNHSTIFKPASKHSLDNFWSSDNCSNLRSQSRTRFPPLLFVGMGSSNGRANRNLHRFQMIRCFKFLRDHRIFG